ncbi:MAG: EAL domain-containing protein, partial [Actinomycetes bacterium]
PAAAGSPLILDIDRLMIDQSLDLLARLPRDQNVAINVDASCLGTSGLRHRIRSEAERLSLDPHRIELEVTEALLITAMAEVRDNMKDLDDFGVEWWVDNFGTGYSSITHLKDMPVTGLKLDRAFTSGVDQGNDKALSLAQGLAGLARGMGLHTTAEGIETTEQASILRAAGWEYGQGWLFGRPMPADQVTSRN